MSFPVVAWVDEMPDPGTYTKTTEDERKVLAAIRAGTHVVVPRKPTEAMREALLAVRAAITNENGLNEGVIVDTLWASDGETAVDRIDAAILAAAEPPA